MKKKNRKRELKKKKKRHSSNNYTRKLENIKNVRKYRHRCSKPEI